MALSVWLLCGCVHIIVGVWVLERVCGVKSGCVGECIGGYVWVGRWVCFSICLCGDGCGCI